MRRLHDPPTWETAGIVVLLILAVTGTVIAAAFDRNDETPCYRIHQIYVTDDGTTSKRVNGTFCVEATDER